MRADTTIPLTPLFNQAFNLSRLGKYLRTHITRLYLEAEHWEVTNIYEGIVYMGAKKINKTGV